MQAIELGRRDRLIDRAPIDRFVRARLVDDVFVARRAAGVKAGIDDERAAKTEYALAPGHGVLVEIRCRQVPVHGPDVMNSLFCKSETWFRRHNRFFGLVQAFLLWPPGSLPRNRPVR